MSLEVEKSNITRYTAPPLGDVAPTPAQGAPPWLWWATGLGALAIFFRPGRAPRSSSWGPR